MPEQALRDVMAATLSREKRASPRARRLLGDGGLDLAGRVGIGPDERERCGQPKTPFLRFPPVAVLMTSASILDIELFLSH
jgi:hypothetical protein